MERGRDGERKVWETEGRGGHAADDHGQDSNPGHCDQDGSYMVRALTRCATGAPAYIIYCLTERNCLNSVVLLLIKLSDYHYYELGIKLIIILVSHHQSKT